MIHEYALEPELVTTWVDRRAGRYFIEKFGVGQSRIVSRYPRRWKRLVWEAFRSENDLHRARMTELLERLGERMVKRHNGSWDDNASWLVNAEVEHARLPFHAILARENPNAHAHVLVADDVSEATPAWMNPSGRIVCRSAEELASAVAEMLRIAGVVVLVDPYFGPGKSSRREVLRALLRAAFEGRPCEAPQRIEVHTAADGDDRPAPEFFREECQRRLPTLIPRGVKVSLIRLRQRPGGERLHNRYILTDLGGVSLGVGLEEGDAGDTDDINILAREQYEVRWRQYVQDVSTFERPEPPVIIDGVA